MRFLPYVNVLVGLLLVGLSPPGWTQSFRVAIPAVAGGPAPAFFRLPSSVAHHDHFLLRMGGREVLAQRWNADSAVCLPPRADRRRTCRVRVAARPLPAAVQLARDDSTLELYVRGQPVLTYQVAVASPPAGAPDYYRRSGFIHPLRSPAGRVLTDGFPAGHTHQHGVFLAWVNTTFRGLPVDFWNQQHQTGTVRHVAVLDTLSGPVFAWFRVRLEHVSLAHGPAVVEELTVVTYATTGAFVIDLFSEQTAATADTLFVNEYHYGGMAFRGSRAWNEVDSNHYEAEMRVLTGADHGRDESNHTRPRWVAGWGALGDAAAGVALFDHPTNFRYPQPVRVHPTMPYFCFSPMVLGGFPGPRRLLPFAIPAGDLRRNTQRRGGGSVVAGIRECRATGWSIVRKFNRHRRLTADV